MTKREGQPHRVERLTPRTQEVEQTLRSSISCSGKGIHSGRETHLTLHPAPPGHGVVFRRLDVAGDSGLVPARWDLVVETTLCTVLANDSGVRVQTPEHLLAALAGAGVDDVLVEIDGPEVPIMDGSADDFSFMIKCVGIRPQPSRRRRRIVVLKPVTVSEGRAWARLEPAGRFTASCTIRYDHPHVGVQSYRFDPAEQDFSEAIGRARTFGFLHEFEALRARGYAKGASLENAVAISWDGVVNEGGLRFPHELPAHKVLDAVGDLALAGAPILGAFRGDCSGHRLNNLMLRALFADESAWRWDDEVPAPARRVVA